MAILVNWLISALAVIISSYVLPGVHVASFGIALISALVLGILNAFLKPLLVILTLPINILTLGLFTFVINTLVILLAARLVDGFEIDGFWWAFIFAIILSVVSGLIGSMFKD